MSAQMSKKQFNALSKGQRAALLPKGTVGVAPRKRRTRRARNPQKSVPVRNGQGRRRGGRRQRGGGNGISLTGKGSTRNFGGTNRRSQSIVEDEFIAAVTVAAQPAFNAVKFPVNIGQAGTFPWGATVAKNYQKYEFDSLEFFYKREVSEFATNGQVGKVMMFFNPDSADPDPTTKQQVEDSQCHADAMPSENFRLVVPPSMLKRLNDAHYVRGGAQPANTDIKTYDVGNLYVCTQGIVNNVEIGELHVHYRCRLMVPVIPGLAGGAPPVSAFASFFQNSAAQNCTTTVNTTMLLATVTVNGIGIVNTSGSLVPPAGNYHVDFYGAARDTSSEIFTCQLDLAKNGTSVYSNTPPRFQVESAIGAATEESIAGSAIVSANGTDAFTFVATMVGAAGTLSMMGCAVTFTSV